MNYKLIAFAQDFCSYLLQNLGGEKIKQIILFGSVSRGEENKNSDIDLFIDVIEEKIESNILTIKDEFYNSAKFKKYWSLLGIKNEINCTIGKLEKWGELKRSIGSNGIILFGKYKEKAEEGEGYSLIKVFPTANRNHNVLIWRKLYGYNQKVKGKLYHSKGLIEENGITRLARGLLAVPNDHTSKIVEFLKKNKVKHQIIPIWKEKI